MSAENKEVVWSDEHKIIFVSSFAVRANNNEIYIDLGTEQTRGGKEVIWSEAQIVLTHQAGRVLQILLDGMFKELEKFTGPVTLPSGTEEKLRQIMAGVTVKTHK